MFKSIKELPRGTRDLIGTECKKIEYVLGTVNKYFDDIGYEEVITPSFEFYNTFNDIDKSIEKQMYKFCDSDGNILSLKSDSTLPIARVVSSRLKDRKFPLRIRYSSKIFRVNKNLSGKCNEIFDCGIELIGEKRSISDIEAIALAIDCLLNLGFDDFKLEIGHIGIIQRIISKLDITIQDKEKLVYLIDEKKLVDLDNFLESSNIKNPIKDVLKKMPWMFGDIKLLKQEKTMIYDEYIKRYMEALEDIQNNLEKLGLAKYVTFDLGVATKIDYYSGIVFKGYIKGAENYILKGGRYDNLMSSYGKNVGAIGFSLKIDKIAGLIEDSLISDDEFQVLDYDDSNYLEILKGALTKRQNGEKINLQRKEDNI